MRRTMAIGLFLALGLTGSAWAQDDKTAELEANYQKKLQKEFATALPWQASLSEASAEAAEQKKLIFGYFTRSYAC